MRVLLVDDPATKWQLQRVLNDAPADTTVVAFDPCQLEETKSDLTWDGLGAIVHEAQAKPIYLKNCYRQKENVGRAAKDVMDAIARSSPFVAADKTDLFIEQRKRLYEAANDLRFPNPHGYVETYRNATTANVREEIKRIRRRRLWKHATPILLVVDEDADCDSVEWDELLGALEVERVTFSATSHLGLLRRIKGLEFQHVLMVLNDELFRELENGFSGATQVVYHRRRLLRIPFSRAKDSLVTFVFPQRLPQENDD